MPAKAKPGAANAHRPYKVFVSSTYLNNKARRRLVQEAITMAGMVWQGMEISPASTHPTTIHQRSSAYRLEPGRMLLS